MNNQSLPKYALGDKVCAHWAGGRITEHVITGIKNTDHGYWYTWEDADSNTGNGLHEHYLSKASFSA